jgi:hypothetical protein
MKCEEDFLETPERKPSCYIYIPVRPRAPAGDAWGRYEGLENEPPEEESTLFEQFRQIFL